MNNFFSYPYIHTYIHATASLVQTSQQPPGNRLDFHFPVTRTNSSFTRLIYERVMNFARADATQLQLRGICIINLIFQSAAAGERVGSIVAIDDVASAYIYIYIYIYIYQE